MASPNRYASKFRGRMTSNSIISSQCHVIRKTGTIAGVREAAIVFVCCCRNIVFLSKSILIFLDSKSILLPSG